MTDIVILVEYEMSYFDPLMPPKRWFALAGATLNLKER
jgi:hypothetical protein